jgi:hypothetical protein
MHDKRADACAAQSQLSIPKKGDDPNLPTYDLLLKSTQAGIETVKDTPQRIERAKEIFKSSVEG